MASPNDYVVKAPEAGTDLLFISWIVGAAGAVGAFAPTTRFKEFRRVSAANPSPVVHGATGVYDIFLRETWIDTLAYLANCLGPIAATAGKIGHLTGEAAGNSPNPKVTITFTRQDTGVAAEPATGDQVYVMLALKKWKPV